MFRKTANEYYEQPKGILNDYKEGTFIDSENNVYYHDGAGYVKIGYDNPNMDTYVKLIPEIGLGVLLLNAFAPKRRSGEDSGIIELIAILLMNAILFLAHGVTSWIGYKIITRFSEKILLATDNKKWMRLFLPFVWFIDNPDKNQLSVAAGSIMFFPYLTLGLLSMLLTRYLHEDWIMFAAIFIIFAIISLIYLIFNIKINKENLVDKF